MIEPTITTHFIVFVIITITSLIMSQKLYESLWKPFSVIFMIGAASKILTRFSNKEILMIVNMGLLAYVNGVLYVEDYDTFASILTFIVLYLNFFNITKNNFMMRDLLTQREMNSILVTRTITFLVVLGFTLLTTTKKIQNP